MEDIELKIQGLIETMIKIKSHTAELIQQSRNDGTLQYYFDPLKCKKGEIIKIENCKEEIISITKKRINDIH